MQIVRTEEVVVDITNSEEHVSVDEMSKAIDAMLKSKLQNFFLAYEVVSPW